MKKLITSALFVLLLTACNQSKTLTYDVTFTSDDPSRMNDLSLATRHVIERRLSVQEAGLIDYDVSHNKETKETQIIVEIDDAGAADILNEQLTEPFLFEVRYLAEDEQEGDIVVEGKGNFRATGVQNEHIDWVLADAVQGPLNQGKIVIGFTDEGVEKMQSIFTEKEGVEIGLFVRNMLTASLSINGDSITRTIEISGVPSAELAKIFADDVNVGIHMTFTPAN